MGWDLSELTERMMHQTDITRWSFDHMVKQNNQTCLSRNEAERRGWERLLNKNTFYMTQDYNFDGEKLT